jgi:hypothetical protein
MHDGLKGCMAAYVPMETFSVDVGGRPVDGLDEIDGFGEDSR